jgi:hypothetical protein
MDYTLLIIAVIVQFVIGALWQSPFIFGKLQKSMIMSYIFQIFLIFISTLFLSIFIKLIPDSSPYLIAIYILLGFYIPTQIFAIIWSNPKGEFWLKQVLVRACYQFISVILATYILTF